MKKPSKLLKNGFTLMETVIAIGVLALLLTGFIAVFAPATEGIRRSINVQEADRLASALEKELVTLRAGQNPTGANTGFDKAFEWIKDSHDAADALFVYQYRGSPNSLREDGTAAPVAEAKGIPGTDYIVQPMVRQKSDPRFTEDLAAIEGNIFVVKCTQLVFDNGEMTSGTAGQIVDPKGGGSDLDSASYPEAVIAFTAEFYSLPSRTPNYLNGSAFATRFPNLKNPVFTRNLAIRR